MEAFQKGYLSNVKNIVYQVLVWKIVADEWTNYIMEAPGITLIVLRYHS